MNVRAFYRAIAVKGFKPPYNILSLKVFYPAKFDDSEEVLNLGIVPPDESLSPFPVVLFLSGVNVSSASYQWLGIEMAKKGVVFITFDWVTDTLPGGKTGLTPGIDLSALTPETYGTKPTSSAIQTLLEELENIQKDSLLAGLLDLNKVILGGHSAGGSIAIMNANQDFFPNVIGAFSYGSHSQGATMLGFPPDTFLPISSEVSILIAGGDADGVISASVKRYGKDNDDCVLPLSKTFEENLHENTKRYLAIFHNSNHFLITKPTDETTGRSYLDNPPSEDVNEKRKVLYNLITEFIETDCLGRKVRADFINLGQNLFESQTLSKFEYR